jgi:RimJ/RimL family protein N-acetyltransferase
MFTIRPAHAGDLTLLYELRVAALTDTPKAFSSTLEREHKRTRENWLSWVTPPSVTYILESAEGEACGLVAGAPDKEDPAIVMLMSMWVHPSQRGTGAARQLIALIQKWATDLRAREVKLFVEEGNDRARLCYERCGFRLTGHSSIGETWGEAENEMVWPVAP